MKLSIPPYTLKWLLTYNTAIILFRVQHGIHTLWNLTKFTQIRSGGLVSPVHSTWAQFLQYWHWIHCSPGWLVDHSSEHTRQQQSTVSSFWHLLAAVDFAVLGILRLAPVRDLRSSGLFLTPSSKSAIYFSWWLQVYYGTAVFSSHLLTLFHCAALILFLFWVLNLLGLYSLHCEVQLSSASDTASCIARRGASFPQALPLRQ